MAKRNDKYKPRSDGRYYTHVSTGKYDENGRPIRISLYAKSSKELEEKEDSVMYLFITAIAGKIFKGYRRPSGI